ncbi:hypothetical protein RchiOBHm_Chr1g0346221 [Rosa chinensis]|uniref:Uncharacterized protein n=1 Tax=Rosa chinensis TaxID=74649 RepID=A0A2P6SEZ8_ROSCH|nr:hypothetical protein RchiOBHm_Chr1g0346221 [Rosa chinensis]
MSYTISLQINFSTVLSNQILLNGLLTLYIMQSSPYTGTVFINPTTRVPFFTHLSPALLSLTVNITFVDM